MDEWNASVAASNDVYSAGWEVAETRLMREYYCIKQEAFK